MFFCNESLNAIESLLAAVSLARYSLNWSSITNESLPHQTSISLRMGTAAPEATGANPIKHHGEKSVSGAPQLLQKLPPPGEISLNFD